MNRNHIPDRHRVAWLALASFATLSLVGSASAQEAKDTKDRKSVSYVGRTADFAAGVPKCSGVICLVPFDDFAIVDGDLNGSSIGSGSFVRTSATKGYSVRLGYFTGTLTGCPNPGNAMSITVTRIDATRANTGTTTILEGSGTGGLSGIGGSFTFTADPAPGSPVIAKGNADCRG